MWDRPPLRRGAKQSLVPKGVLSSSSPAWTPARESRGPTPERASLRLVSRPADYRGFNTVHETPAPRGAPHPSRIRFSRLKRCIDAIRPIHDVPGPTTVTHPLEHQAGMSEEKDPDAPEGPGPGQGLS